MLLFFIFVGFVGCRYTPRHPPIPLDTLRYPLIPSDLPPDLSPNLPPDLSLDLAPPDLPPDLRPPIYPPI